MNTLRTIPILCLIVMICVNSMPGIKYWEGRGVLLLNILILTISGISLFILYRKKGTIEKNKTIIMIGSIIVTAIIFFINLYKN